MRWRFPPARRLLLLLMAVADVSPQACEEAHACDENPLTSTVRSRTRTHMEAPKRWAAQKVLRGFENTAARWPEITCSDRWRPLPSSSAYSLSLTLSSDFSIPSAFLPPRFHCTFPSAARIRPFVFLHRSSAVRVYALIESVLIQSSRRPQVIQGGFHPREPAHGNMPSRRPTTHRVACRPHDDTPYTHQLL